MGVSDRKKRVICFDEFRVDLLAGEIHREGQNIPVSEKPFQVLALLLEHPGELVTREQLSHKLWPAGIHVNFDHNINITIARLRCALSDSAVNPKFIETVASRGYRFIGNIVEENKNPGRSPLEQFRTEESKNRLAVLPFENLIPGQHPMWLNDGITEEIIARLGHLFSRRLGIIARTSTLKYKGTTKSIAQIGRELKVSYVLEGNVQCMDDRMHITVHLVRVVDQTCLWTESYEHEMCDVLVAQNVLAERVVQALGDQLFADEKKNSIIRPTPNREATLLYLEGCHFAMKRTEGSLRKSVDCFERALQIDPNYAQAYSALAYSLSLLVVHGFGPSMEFSPRAIEAAVKGLEINGGLSECNTSLALIKFLYKWDWEGAEQLYRRAIQLNPSYALAHQLYSYYLSSMGRHEEALRESQWAYELDPLSLPIITAVGIAHYFGRKYGNAIEVFLHALDLEPTFGMALMWLGAAYSQNSMHDEAILVMERTRAHSPENTTIMSWLGKAYATAGKENDAQILLKKLETISQKRYVSAFDFALVYAGLGQMNLAFEWLEKAYEEMSPLLVISLKVDPRLDNLRADTRYESLSQRIWTGH